MVPYQGRSAIRLARVVLALTCLAWYPFTAGARVSSALAFIIAYAIFSVGALFETKFDSTPLAVVFLRDWRAAREYKATLLFMLSAARPTAISSIWKLPAWRPIRVER